MTEAVAVESSTPEIKLTAGQERALQLARELAKEFRHGEPGVGTINGPAGTGKTTLLKIIAREIGTPTIIAPTGRAALRVREATGLYAETCHKWLYIPQPDEEFGGETRFRLRLPEELSLPENHVLIVDEASMLSKALWDDIFAVAAQNDLNILLVGDAFQLPPVQDYASAGFSVFNDDFYAGGALVTLDEVMRQALDSPIIRASMKIRLGDPQSGLQELERVQSKGLVDAACEAFADGGVAICHRNKTRHGLNFAMRAAFGIDGPLHNQEPLLVLKNNYDLGRYNGEIVRFEGFLGGGGTAEVEDRRKGIVEHVSFVPADVGGMTVLISPEELAGQTQSSEHVLARAARDWARTYKIGRRSPATGKIVPYPYLNANLGWAMTAHKMQGSEIPHALVLMEGSIRLSELDGRRWAYTAVTRASKTAKIAYLDRFGIQPPRRKRAWIADALPPVRMRVLVAGADELVGRAAEVMTKSAVKACYDPTSEALIENAEDAVEVLSDYDGLIVVPRSDGTLTAADEQLLAAARTMGKTALRWVESIRSFEPAK